MPTDRRYPYQPLDRTLIRDFLRGRDIVSAQLLRTGKCNTNYQLILSDGETCVLRLYSRGSAEREIYLMDLVRDLVPVPHEIDRGETWSVFSWLEGELLETVPEYVGAAAEAIAFISSVEFESPGSIHTDGSISAFAFGGLTGFIDQQLANPGLQAWLGAKSVAAIGSIQQREAWRLDQLDRECRLVHGDFNPTNILICRGRVSGILDWEYGHAGTPYMDIGNLLRYANAKYHSQIKVGLEAGGMPVPDDWQQRAELVDLTSQLEFLTSKRSERFKRQCAARIEKFITKFGHSYL